MIGVFDSGLGGLTAVRELRRFMPGADICYLGDVKNAPYGTKSENELTRLVKSDIDRLEKKGADRILIACCTASTVYPLLDSKQREISVPIIEPTAKRAAAVTESGRIGIIATERTTASHAFADAVKRYLPKADITELATQELVLLTESGECDGFASKKAIEQIHRILEPIKYSKADTLILGCTHFPYLEEIIGEYLSGVRIVSSSREGAKALASISPHTEGTGKIEFLY